MEAASGRRKPCAGLMIRSGEHPSELGSMAALMISEDAVRFIRRMKEGFSTIGVAPQISLPAGDHYPLRLKIALRGRYLTGYYRTPEDDGWRIFHRERLFQFPFDEKILCGVFAFSGAEGVPIQADFSHYHAEVYTEEYTPLPAIAEAAPQIPKLLFHEDFSRGALVTASHERFFWTGVDGSANLIELHENGRAKRVRFKNAMPGLHFIGSPWWADYSARMELRFDEAHAGRVFFMVRHRNSDCCGTFGYALCLEDGNRLSLYRSCPCTYLPNMYEADCSVPLDYFASPGAWHTLRVDALDQFITVYWDGQPVMAYEDTHPLISGIGNIGLITDSEARVCIGEITVTELEDPIGGGWDQPAPADFRYNYETGIELPPVRQADNTEV